jgi:hypothetical protein
VNVGKIIQIDGVKNQGEKESFKIVFGKITDDQEQQDKIAAM